MSQQRSEIPDPLDETNLSLLGKTQDYLKATMSAQNPDTILSAAWDEFYRIYNELIRRYVRARSIPDAEVEDCVQEVWVAVARHLIYFHRPKDRPGLRAWLFTLVRTKAADVLKRRGRGGQSLQQMPEQECGTGNPSTGDVWTRLLLETVLDEVQKETDELNCRILRMRLLEGYRTAEIAAAVDLPPAAVRYRFQRLLKKLRLRIATYTGDQI
jgi:RNA polymerase sigma factor (sigma-70 family)